MSESVASPITIDGFDADWSGAIRPVTDHAGLGVGVRNDGDALYVAVVMRNESQVRQALTGGLTLWLDPGGGKKQAYGVRFPVGAGGGTGADGGRRAGPPDAGALEARLAAATPSLEVVRDGATSGPRQPADGDGVQAAATLEAGVLVAEYRIPLAGAADALGASAGDAIGLGLVTTAPERPERSDDGARAGRGGGGGGGRGGGGRGAGGGQGGRRGGGGGANAGSGRAAPLSVWIDVELAAAAAR